VKLHQPTVLPIPASEYSLAPKAGAIRAGASEGSHAAAAVRPLDIGLGRSLLQRMELGYVGLD
jgi:hypothetical protein